MALFDTNSQAPQLGFAPSPTLSGSFTQAPVPVGYGQMQGQPTLSRNPNYGVPSGIAALLGGANPMGAPQPSATLTPQQAVATLTPGRADPTSMSQFGTSFGLGGPSQAPPPMPGTNPFTGQAFQTFDPTEAANIFTQGRIAEEQTAAQAFAQSEADRVAAEQAAAAQAEADRIAAEQVEADRIAAEQAAAEAEAARTPYDDPALEQLRSDVMAQGPESYGTKLYEDLLNAFDTSNRTDQIVAQNNAALEQARAEAEASSLALAEAQAEAAAAKEQLSGFFNPSQGTTPEPEPAIPAMSPVPDVMPPAVAPIPAIDSPIMQMGAFSPEANMAGMFDRVLLPTEIPEPAPLPEPPLIERPSVVPSRQDVMRPPLPPPPPPPPAPVALPLEPEAGLGDRLRGMGGIFANAVAPGDVGYEDLAAAATRTGGGLASGVQRPVPTPRPVPLAPPLNPNVSPRMSDIGKLLGGARGSGSLMTQPQPTPAVPVGIDALLGGGRGEPANIPMPAPMPALPSAPPVMSEVDYDALVALANQPPPPPPMVTPAEARAAATPMPTPSFNFSENYGMTLPPKPKTQKVTKPKKGRKVVPQPDQRSSKKKRRRKQRGPR